VRPVRAGMWKELAAGAEWQPTGQPSRLGAGRARGGVSDGRRIGPPRAALQVRELMTQGGDAARGKTVGEGMVPMLTVPASCDDVIR
jgi:hypothetical protein